MSPKEYGLGSCTFTLSANEWPDEERRRFNDFLFGVKTNPTNIPQIKNIIFNNPATIVYWQDGTKTVVKTMHGDTFNEEYGVAMAYVKKIFGSSTGFKKLVAKYKKEEKPVNKRVEKEMPLKIEDIKPGQYYEVVKNRESYYGSCTDLIEIEGQIIRVDFVNSDDDIDITSKKRTHACRVENLKSTTQTELGEKKINI
jgi:hypothetical protein